MKKILIIRSFDIFSRILSENEFELINLPLIETKPLEDLSDFELKLKAIENYDGIFLTSRNAAQIFAEKVDELKTDCSGKVYVLGKGSFEILKDKNFDLVFFEEANNAEELLEKISLDDLKNKKFLFVRGDKSLETIPNFLKNFAAVDESIVYSNQPMYPSSNKITEITKAIEDSEIEAVCFFSPSAAESFLTTFGAEILHQTKIATIGKTTADFFERRNFEVDFVSPKASAKDFAVELIEYLRKDLSTKNTKNTK